MKKIFTLIVTFFCFTAFSQTQNDIQEIVELVVKSYQADNVIVYHKFDNRQLAHELFGIKSSQESKIYEQILQHPDSLSMDRLWEIVGEHQSDTATMTIRGMRIFYNSNYLTTENNDGKKLNRFFRTNYQKRRLKQPLAFISTPIIATDNKKAFVYATYVCGGFCGNGGLFLLVKINNTWQIAGYDIQSIP